MDISKSLFGVLPDGGKVHLFNLKAGELELSVCTFGATLTSLIVPSKKFGTADVLLGYDGFTGYANNTNYFGVTVGRYANRINRAKFNIGGKEYQISANKPNCSLHGGKTGFPKRLWDAQAYEENGSACVRLEYYSPDGDQGYPGNMRASVTYALTANNELTTIFEGKIDAECPINLTNHSYYNLAGEGNGRNILETQATLYCSSYVEVDEGFIPTGRVLPTEGTPMDFRAGKSIGQDIAPLLEEKIGGYDHCFSVDGEYGTLRLAGEFYEPMSGRGLKLYITQPGLQFYTGNMLTSVTGKNDHEYKKNWGFCIEPEFFPDTPNQPGFPPALFGPERDYYERSVLAFNW